MTITDATETLVSSEENGFYALDRTYAGMFARN